MDEFYTQLSDIERELEHYRKLFRGKVVYCNCDDPRVSNFYKYFADNFEQLGLKKLIASCYQSQQVNLLDQNPPERAISLEYTGTPDPEIRLLDGDGDFRSPESVELLKSADIVVTNPPFSLFRGYVAQLIRHDKQFLIIGPKTAIAYKDIFPLIKGGQVRLGCNNQDTKWFRVPDDYDTATTSSVKVEDGAKYISMRNTYWFTTLEHNKRCEDLILYKAYDPEEYPTYDNYVAIEVGKTKEIPVDYDGVMGVPISFMDKYNPDQFEILGATQRGCHDAVPDTKKYDDYREMRQDGTPTGSSGGSTNENANLVGNDGKKNYFINDEGRVVQSVYQRLFIRARPLS